VLDEVTSPIASVHRVQYVSDEAELSARTSCGVFDMRFLPTVRPRFTMGNLACPRSPLVLSFSDFASTSMIVYDIRLVLALIDCHVYIGVSGRSLRDGSSVQKPHLGGPACQSPLATLAYQRRRANWHSKDHRIMARVKWSHLGGDWELTKAYGTRLEGLPALRGVGRANTP
jgi:hypothetical protein